jgi:multicomponent Na+:H+ antiporter subunit D
MRAAMLLFAFLCIAIGVYPAPLYALLPFPVDYQPYTVAHLVAQFQLLLFSGLAFFALLPLMRRTETVSLDLDWFYRRLATRLVRWLLRHGDRARARLVALLGRRADDVLAGLFRTHGPHGVLARSSPTGSMVLWVALLLALLLLAGYA